MMMDWRGWLTWVGVAVAWTAVWWLRRPPLTSPDQLGWLVSGWIVGLAGAWAIIREVRRR